MRWRIEFLALLALASCATAPLPAPDMSSGWTVRQGQAIWSPKGEGGIAGELLVATNTGGNFVVEFAKPPITIAQARRTGDRWEFGFPGENKTYRGRGAGPARVLWLHLADALAGRDGAWQVTTNSNGWRISNQRGETLEGFLAP